MRIFSFSLMGCCFFSLVALAEDLFPDIPQFKEVTLMAEHVFVPQGFDSNDNSEVVVTGWYPNPCYEWSRVILDKTAEGVEISLKAFVKQGLDRVCIDMAVPYMESVKLGSLQEGKSRLFVGALNTEMVVAKSDSASIDDHLYGQVRRVRADEKTLVLEIENPSSCIELDHIESIFNGKDTCSILPIMRQITKACPRDPRTFEYRFTIPEECLQGDKVLFHVRSLEGKAVNFLLKN